MGGTGLWPGAGTSVVLTPEQKEIARALRAVRPKRDETYLIPRLEQWAYCRNAITVALLKRDPSFDIDAFKMLSEDTKERYGRRTQ